MAESSARGSGVHSGAIERGAVALRHHVRRRKERAHGAHALARRLALELGPGGLRERRAPQVDVDVGRRTVFVHFVRIDALIVRSSPARTRVRNVSPCSDGPVGTRNAFCSAAVACHAACAAARRGRERQRADRLGDGLRLCVRCAGDLDQARQLVVRDRQVDPEVVVGQADVVVRRDIGRGARG